MTASILSLFVDQGLLAFTISPRFHQQITNRALSEEDGFKYSMPNGLQVPFSAVSLKNITQGNAYIDVYSLAGEYKKFHFDNEEFGWSQWVIFSLRDQVIVNLRDDAFGESENANLARQAELVSESQDLLGNALHVIQDYYSHSNWVEQGHSDINENVGKKGVPLNDPPESLVCSEDSPGTAELTSGDYLAWFVVDCFHICDARPNKCAHGNVSGCPQDCGINKDNRSRNGFVPARDFAILHTARFVRDLLAEVLNTTGPERYAAETAVCLFMGHTLTEDCHTTATLQVHKLDNETASSAISEGIVISDPAGINCGNACIAGLFVGSSVRLTAGYSAGWKFVEWAFGGECALSTDPVCVFTMPETAAVATAIFEECTNESQNCQAKVYWLSGFFNTPVEIVSTYTTHVVNQNQNDTWTNTLSQVGSVRKCNPDGDVDQFLCYRDGTYICEIDGVWVPRDERWRYFDQWFEQEGCSQYNASEWGGGTFQLDSSGQLTVTFEYYQSYRYSCNESPPYKSKTSDRTSQHNNYRISLASGAGSYDQDVEQHTIADYNAPGYGQVRSTYDYTGSGAGNWPAEAVLPPTLPGVNLNLSQTYASGEELPWVCAPTALP